jgi:hypothetical protein
VEHERQQVRQVSHSREDVVGRRTRELFHHRASARRRRPQEVEHCRRGDEPLAHSRIAEHGTSGTSVSTTSAE